MMNKYQKARAKRMKRLSKLGMNRSMQKQMLRNHSLEDIDNMLKQIDIMNESSVISVVSKIIQSFKAIFKKFHKEF